MFRARPRPSCDSEKIEEVWRSNSKNTNSFEFGTQWVVRLGLLHYCPVFAGTKLTNLILGEMEKSWKRKTPGVTRFTKPAVPTPQKWPTSSADKTRTNLYCAAAPQWWRWWGSNASTYIYWIMHERRDWDWFHECESCAFLYGMCTRTPRNTVDFH